MEEYKLFFDIQKNIDTQMKASTLEITKQYTEILNSLYSLNNNTIENEKEVK